MLSSPKLSVVMPVYNHAKYVRDAVASVLRQDYQDFELIVVDDGSMDGSLDVVRSIRDDRIRVVARPHEGFIRTLTAGIAECKGKWIARMDSDDLIPPNRFSTQMKFLDDHPEATFVSSVYGYITPNGRLLERVQSFESQVLAPRNITVGPRLFADASVVFNRRLAEQVGGYDESYENENPLWYRLMHAGPAYVLGDCLYFARYQATSHSRSPSEVKANANLRLRQEYDPVNADDWPVEDYRDGRRFAYSVATSGARYSMMAGDFQAARRFTRSAIALSPFSRKSWRVFAEVLVSHASSKARRRFAVVGLQPVSQLERS
jgi:glycosyltransferase involved in cell wall biosynthesis